MAPLTYISLFSGVGGLDLGFGLATEARCVLHVEGEIYAAGVLAKRIAEGALDDAPVWSDIRTIDFKDWAGVDAIIGGFPCQDLSVAGKQAGIIEGNRSGLWFEFARAIREARPRIVFVENVPGLLSNRNMGRVLGDLAEMGFDAEWGVFSAAECGASHRRERLFILAYRECTKRWPEAERRGHLEQGCDSERQAASGVAECRGVLENSRHARSGRPTEPAGLDRQRASGDDRGASRALADSSNAGLEGRQLGTSRNGNRRGQEAHGSTPELRYASLPIFPPGPNDHEQWKEIIERWPELAPAVADGDSGRLGELRESSGRDGSGLLSSSPEFLGRFGPAPLLCLKNPHYVFGIPNPVCHASGHRRGHTEGLVNLAEIVVHVVERDRRRMVLKLLRERIGQPGEPAHVHSHGEVLPLHVGRGDVISVRIAADDPALDSDALRRRVPIVGVQRTAVNLNKHRVIHVGPKSVLDGNQIRPMAVGCDLDAKAKPGRKIVHKFNRASRIALADKPRRDKLRIGINRYPRPHIATAKLPTFFGGKIPFLCPAEAPDFIKLQTATGQIAKGRILVFAADFSDLTQKPHNRFLRHASHTDCSANGGSFNQTSNHLRARCVVQSSHASIVHEPLKHSKHYFTPRADQGGGK